MARNPKVRDFSGTLDFGFKRAFHTEAEGKNFSSDLEKHIKKTCTGIAFKGVKFVFRGTGAFMVARGQNHMNVSVRRDAITVSIDGKASRNDVKALDQFLNRLIGFLEISKQSLRGVTGAVTSNFQFRGNPADMFYNKSAIADFASKSKMRLTPIGVAVQIVKSPDSSLLCMFSYSSKKEATELIISQYIRRVKQPWDILGESNDRILAAKDQILKAFGAKEQ